MKHYKTISQKERRTTFLEGYKIDFNNIGNGKYYIVSLKEIDIWRNHLWYLRKDGTLQLSTHDNDPDEGYWDTWADASLFLEKWIEVYS